MFGQRDARERNIERLMRRALFMHTYRNRLKAQKRFVFTLTGRGNEKYSIMRMPITSIVVNCSEALRNLSKRQYFWKNINLVLQESYRLHFPFHKSFPFYRRAEFSFESSQNINAIDHHEVRVSRRVFIIRVKSYQNE